MAGLSTDVPRKDGDYDSWQKDLCHGRGVHSRSENKENAAPEAQLPTQHIVGTR